MILHATEYYTPILWHKLSIKSSPFANESNTFYTIIIGLVIQSGSEKHLLLLASHIFQ